MSNILFVGVSGIDLFFKKMSIFENQKNNEMSPFVNNLLKNFDKIDFSLIKFKVQEELHWSDERIDNAISEYCKILIMIKLKVKIITTNDIDEIWKNHLITKQYIDDCYYFFGDYLDYADMTINNNAEIKQNMINMYKKYFCQDFVF